MNDLPCGWIARTEGTFWEIYRVSPIVIGAAASNVGYAENPFS